MKESGLKSYLVAQVAPKITTRAKIVWGYSGHKTLVAGVVQLLKH
jgi:hypothetical protein